MWGDGYDLLSDSTWGSPLYISNHHLSTSNILQFSLSFVNYISIKTEKNKNWWNEMKNEVKHPRPPPRVTSPNHLAPVVLSFPLCLPRAWYHTRHMISTEYLLNESIMKSFNSTYHKVLLESLSSLAFQNVLLLPIDHLPHTLSFLISCIDSFLCHPCMFFLLSSREISSIP